MAKFEYDKYYTPDDVCDKIMQKISNFITDQSILIEPSAGDGRLFKKFPSINLKFAYDLYPDDDCITQLDWLNYKPTHNSKDVVIIGNPPFGGRGGSLLSNFILKSLEVADVVGFILPLYWSIIPDKFTSHKPILVEELGTINYDNGNNQNPKPVKSCFIIFKRYTDLPPRKKKFIKPDIDYIVTSKRIKNPRSDAKNFKKVDSNYFGILAWHSNIGKLIPYTQKYKYASVIWINNKHKDIKKFLETYDWTWLKDKSTSTPVLRLSVLANVLIQNGLLK